MATSVPPRPVYIYALLDPRTDEVRYIGRTTNPGRRLSEHTQPNHLTSQTWRTHWLKSLLAAGLHPLMVILEQTTEAAWREAERRHIAAQRAAGARLTNATDGGDGMLGWQMPATTRLKMAAAFRGRPGRAWTDAQRLAASKARQGRPGWRWTVEQRQALSVKRAGCAPAPQTVAAVVAAHKGKPLSDEQRAKIAEALTGRIRSPEHCAALAAVKKGRKGRPHSPETRAKMSAAHMGHKDRKNARHHERVAPRP